MTIIFKKIFIRGWLNSYKNLLTTEEAKKLYESYSTKDIKNRDPFAFLKINKYTSIVSYIEDGERVIIIMVLGMTIHAIVINKSTNEVCVYKGIFDNMFFREKQGSRTFIFGCTDSKGVYYHTSTSRSNGVSELQEKYKAGALSPDVIGLEKLKDLTDEDNPILLYYEFKD